MPTVWTATVGHDRVHIGPGETFPDTLPTTGNRLLVAARGTCCPTRGQRHDSPHAPFACHCGSYITVDEIDLEAVTGSHIDGN